MFANAFIRLMVFALAITMLTMLAQGSPLVFKAHVFQNCMDTIKKHPPYKPPSRKCINTVTKSNLVSICSVLDASDEEKISVERLVSLGRQFGQHFTPGAKCGSKLYSTLLFYFIIFFYIISMLLYHYHVRNMT
jgi:hypothetical protein